LLNLKKYFKKYPMFIFKGFENVSPSDFVSFVRKFDDNCDNDVLDNPYENKDKMLQSIEKFPEYPHIELIGNYESSNENNIKKIIVEPHSAFINNYLWHTDILGYKTKLTNVITGLYIIENPLIGGDSDFISGERIYENLTDQEKRAANNILIEINRSKIIKREAFTDYSGVNRIEKYTNKDPNNVKIPIVYAPDNKNEKPRILITPSFFEKVVGWEVDESRKWMKKFMNEKVLPYRVSIQWKKNDLVVFNNRRFMHSTTPVRNYMDNKDSSKSLFYQTFIPTKKKLLAIKPNNINSYSSYNLKWTEKKETSKLSTEFSMKFLNAMLKNYNNENVENDNYYTVYDYIQEEDNPLKFIL